MQITTAEVIPIKLILRQPVQMAGMPEISSVDAFFIRLEVSDGRVAWGCGVAHPDLTGEDPARALENCSIGIDMAPDLHPFNLEYSLSTLRRYIDQSPAAICAFDLAFHDLLGLVAGMPLYRLLGGFRHKIQTSATVPVGGIDQSVEMAARRVAMGFRILKIKGGQDPELDVQRVKAIKRALPGLAYRLDADGGYSVTQALDVARALADVLEMLEEPVATGNLSELEQVTRLSPVPVLADQSVSDPLSALNLASGRVVNGISIKLANCGGVRCAQQMDAVARAAQIRTMIGCVIEPKLLTAAGLALALSSPNVEYGDLDGYLDIENDPTKGGFSVQDGWLVATEVPGLGCTVDLLGE